MIKTKRPAVPRRFSLIDRFGTHDLLSAPRNKKDPAEEQGYHYWLVNDLGKIVEYSTDRSMIADWRVKYFQK